MSSEQSPEGGFVYAYHDNQYAEAIGQSLVSHSKDTEAVAVEWADIGSTPQEVEQATMAVRILFETITSPYTKDHEVSNALNKLGPFYGRLLKPLAGSEVEVRLVDVYEYPEIGAKSAYFNNFELGSGLARAISRNRISIEGRKEEIFSLAQRGADIYKLREDVTLDQLRDMGHSFSRLGVFLGAGHLSVSRTLGREGWNVRESFLPELSVWDGGLLPNRESHIPSFHRLLIALKDGNVDAKILEKMTDKALLTEFVRAYIQSNPKLAQEVGGSFGAMIAATRVVEQLDENRIEQKLKSVVKANQTQSPIGKLLSPLLPKHSISVLAH